MASTAPTPPSGESPVDLLSVLRRSRLLPDREFEDVRARVLRGEYPRDPDGLAERLVGDQVLTPFQARRLLRNKADGLVIDRYVVLDRLGAGSKGRVFRARHRLMGREVALKVIAPEIANRPSTIARFHREMRLIGRLDHPNVVRAFDADRCAGLLYIVMEYVPGRSLEVLFEERGPLGVEAAARYAAQAARGLAHAHERGIIHRDVKPANLLVGEGGVVKVLDLGLGALMEGGSGASFATAAGLAVGTVDYMSPEQALGAELDGRTDLFSLGCTFYFLLTGRLPFPGQTIPDRLAARIEGRPAPIAGLRPDLPADFRAVLDRLLARRPEDRFPTATAAAEALESVARPWDAKGPVAAPAAPPLTTPAPEVPGPVAPPPSPLPAGHPSRRFLLVVPGVVLAAFVAGFALGCLVARAPG